MKLWGNMHLSLFKPFQPKMGYKWASTNKDLFPNFGECAFLEKFIFTIASFAIYLYLTYSCNQLQVRQVEFCQSMQFPLMMTNEWTHLFVQFCEKTFKCFLTLAKKWKCLKMTSNCNSNYLPINNVEKREIYSHSIIFEKKFVKITFLPFLLNKLLNICFDEFFRWE